MNFVYSTKLMLRAFFSAEVRIAGHTTDYVNKVLDKLRNGSSSVTNLDDL